MNLLSSDVVGAIQDVWACQLGAHPVPIGDVIDVREHPTITAVAAINGSEAFAVVFEIPSRAARAMRWHDLGVAATQATPQEAIIARLVHLVADRLRQLVDPAADVFPASITEGMAYRVAFPGMTRSQRLTLGWQAETMWVSIYTPAPPSEGR